MNGYQDDEKLRTVAEVAYVLDVSRETVRRKCRTRQWEATKIGRLYRFTEAQYQAIITPPPAPHKTRSQRRNIDRLMSVAS